jgi:hypothetical protein
MSVAEMKLAAISEIGKLRTEEAVKEILDHLNRLKKENKDPFDAEIFLNKVSEKYDDVLRKLAQ